MSLAPSAAASAASSSPFLTVSPVATALSSSLSLSSSVISSVSLATSSASEPTATVNGGIPFFNKPPSFPDVPGTSTYSARNQSGLTTQLLVCAVTGTILFLLFCFLRPRWTVIFAPRLNMKRHKPPVLPDSMFGWIIPLIKIDQQQLVNNVGLDAVVMLQFIVMAIKLFSCCSFFGVVALIPISVTRGNITEANVTSTLDRLAITVLEDASNSLIAYLIFMYLFCFLTFFFLHQNFRTFLSLRSEYLLRLSKTLPCRSVMVTGIPRRLRTDEALADYYQHLGIGQVESAHVVRHIRNLNSLLKKRASALAHLEKAYALYWGNPCPIPDYDPDRILDDAQLYQRVEMQQRAIEQDGQAIREQNATFLSGLVDLPGRLSHASGRKTRRPQIRPGWYNFCGKKVDMIDYYTEKFDDLDRQVCEARQSGDFEMTNVGFVTFQDMSSALIASQIAINPDPFNCRTMGAYEPRDVLWYNVIIRGRERLVRETLVWAVTILLSFFWIFPISAFSTLTSVDTLQRVFPKLVDAAEDSPILQNIIQGLIPTLAVNIFMAILPLIFDALGHIQGIRARSAIAEATFSKYFFFLLFNVVLVFTIASTITKTIEELINHPAEVANLLGTTLPAVAPFFINYTILQGMLLMPMGLLLIGALIVRGFTHVFLCKTPRDYAQNRTPWSFDYGTGYPSPLLIFIIVLEYSTISPIILLFGAVYFCITYIVYKYQFLYVYFRPYDANGAAWNMVFPRVIVGMIIFQLTMIGLFVLKKYIVLGVLCVPLIVMTVLFKLVMDAAYKKNCEHLPMQLLRDKVNRLPTHHEAAKETSSSKSRDSTATPPSLTATPATDSENDTDDDDDSSHDDDQAKKLVDSTATVQNRWQRAVHFASSKASLQPQASDSGSLQPTQPLSRSQSRHKRVVLDEDDYEAIPDRRTDYRQPPMMLNPGILDTGFKKYGNPALVGVLPQLWLPVKCPVSGEIRQPLDRSKRLSSSHRNNERGQSSGHLASDLARMLRRAESAARHRAAVALTVGGKGGGPDGGDDHNSRSLVPADAHYSQHESLAKEDRNKTQ